ncbi:hypothetical protein D3C81_1365470 [compost metagenome]
MGAQGSAAWMSDPMLSRCDRLYPGNGLFDFYGLSRRSGVGVRFFCAGPCASRGPVRRKGSSPGAHLLHDPERVVCRTVPSAWLMATNIFWLAGQLLCVFPDGARYLYPCAIRVACQIGPNRPRNHFYYVNAENHPEQ